MTVHHNLDDHAQHWSTGGDLSIGYDKGKVDMRLTVASRSDYLDYLAEANKRESYLWHHKFLRVLEENGKPERWLLKDPSHLGNLEEILGVYPDACFIHIRRDPSETLPSICSLTKQVRRGFSKNIDLNELGQKTLVIKATSLMNE